VISSTEALSLKAVPRRLAVVGAGYIGLELGTAFAKMGAAVTVIEALPRILPQYDAELTRPVGERLHELGVTVLTVSGRKSWRRRRTGLSSNDPMGHSRGLRPTGSLSRSGSDVELPSSPPASLAPWTEPARPYRAAERGKPASLRRSERSSA
jgi:hypothetical protein